MSPSVASCVSCGTRGVRQSVNAMLRNFQRRGWIFAEGPVLRVRDAAALARFIGSCRPWTPSCSSARCQACVQDLKRPTLSKITS
jgi:hypothetical protein